MNRIKREERFEIRCTAEEKKILIAKTKESGYLCVADFIRDRVFKDSQLVLDASGFIKALTVIGKEMNMIGNNINQIARVIHSQEKIGIPINQQNTDEINYSYREYNRTMQSIEKLFRSILRKFNPRRNKK